MTWTTVDRLVLFIQNTQLRWYLEYFCLDWPLELWKSLDISATVRTILNWLLMCRNGILTTYFSYGYLLSNWLVLLILHVNCCCIALYKNLAQTHSHVNVEKQLQRHENIWLKVSSIQLCLWMYNVGCLFCVVRRSGIYVFVLIFI